MDWPAARPVRRDEALRAVAAGDRRLRALADRGLAAMVPEARGPNSGHVALVSYRDGEVLDQLPDGRFVAACTTTGRALRRIHDSGALTTRRRRCPRPHRGLPAG